MVNTCVMNKCEHEFYCHAFHAQASENSDIKFVTGKRY